MPMYVIFQYNVLFMEHGIDCISMHLPDLRLEIHFVPNANSITFFFFSRINRSIDVNRKSTILLDYFRNAVERHKI